MLYIFASSRLVKFNDIILPQNKCDSLENCAHCVCFKGSHEFELKVL